MASRFGNLIDQLFKAEVDVASAATCDIGAAPSENVRITGVVTITSFGTNGLSGVHRWVRFAGALTLTHNATSLILPSGANITTAANDRAEVVSLGGGNWLVRNYVPADGHPPKDGWTVTLPLAVGNSPADGQTLYLGADTAVLRTTYADASLRIPRAGTLKNVYVKVIVATVLGSGENVTMAVRINDTTDVALGTMTWAAAATGLNADVSQAVAAGDTYVLKIVCPTWVTNPTGVRMLATLYFE